MSRFLPVSKLSPAACEILAEIVLSQKDQAGLIENIADGMTPDKTAEMMVEIIDSCKEYKEFCEFDKMGWLVRMAYIFGFATAIDAYSQSIEEALRT